MTRRGLLRRLQQIEAQGGNMDLPIAVRVSERAPDRRTRDGYRVKETWSTVQFCMNGGISFGGGQQYGELLAEPLK